MPESYGGLTIPSYADAADAPKGFRDFVDSGAIPRFANAAARDAAITTPTAGMLVYLIDSGTFVRYSGATWGSPFLSTTGGSLTGSLAMGGNRITGVGAPVDGTDAARKTELDGKAATVHTHSGADITTGTVAEARIASLSAAKITTGTFAAARIPSLDASKITTGTVASARLPSATTSVAGIVQLTTSTSGTSTTLAGTASAVKAAYDAGAAGLRSHTGTLRTITVSTSAPSGGTNGDVWFRV